MRYHKGGAPDSPFTLNPRFRNASELITEFVVLVGRRSDGTAAPYMQKYLDEKERETEVSVRAAGNRNADI
jgi:hypothetical protein